MWIAPRIPWGPEIVRPRRGSRTRRRVPTVLRPAVEDLEHRCLLSAAGSDPYQPTPAEQYMLALINRARANPAAEGQRLVALAQTDPVLAAATRSWNLNRFLQVIDSFGPEPPLAFNTGLIEAARDHDAAMLATNDQFHSPPGYLNNPQVATAANGQAYYPTNTSSWATGENIFAYSGNLPANSSTQDYVDYFEAAFLLDWGNADFGHLENLLAPGPAEASPGTISFSEIGIGLLTGVTPTVPPAANNPIPANAGLNVGPDLVTQEFGWRSDAAFLTGVVFNDSNHDSLYTPGEGLGGVTIQAVGQSGQGTFQTQTWDAGGYSLALPAGTYSVTAEGGSLPATEATTITIGQDNVAWNIPLSPSGGNSTSAPTSTQTPTPTPTPVAAQAVASPTAFITLSSAPGSDSATVTKLGARSVARSRHPATSHIHRSHHQVHPNQAIHIWALRSGSGPGSG
jgi:hypothetical protein